MNGGEDQETESMARGKFIEWHFDLQPSIICMPS